MSPRAYLDVHVLQTVPPSNVNRDDTGSPKSAMYGGVRRARVSSQAWKRATRAEFEDILDTAELGVRSKRLVELVAAAITRIDHTMADSAEAWGEALIKQGGIKLEKKSRKKALVDEPEEHQESKYLVFLSNRQIETLARAGVEAARSEPDPTKGAKSVNAKAILDRDHSVDIALFGRMVADITDLNVDAAAQVAHALSVHAVDTEYDYYTAVDDEKRRAEDEDAGAGMIGTIEFNSSTLYRFATVNLPLLGENLGDAAATARAVSAFVRAFSLSMPTGKQNTFANRTMPDAVIVRLRADQPVNLVGAFEDPVREEPGGGRVVAACRKLAVYDQQLGAAFGGEPQTWITAVGPAGEALASMGPLVPFDKLVAEVTARTSERLGELQ